MFLLLRYAWLMDDAYVYFRYVDNWVLLGHGLVFNRGEYVEGYSSPLWALLLGGLRKAGLGYWPLVRIVGVAAFLATALAMIRLNRRLAPPGAARVDFALPFVAFAYGPLCYFTSGLETPLVQLAAPLYALFLVSPATLGLDLALALSPLLRHELALPLGLAALFVWARDRRFPWRLFLLSAAATGLWLAFRVHYYADLFQNTFYLKNVVEPRQGWIYLWNTVGTYGLHGWLALHAGLVVWLARRGSSPSFGRERVALLVIALALTAFVVKIGGDPRHYRYLAFPFLLVLCALSGIAEQALARLAPARPRLAAAAASLAVAGLAFAARPPQLLAHPFALGEQAVLVDGIKDAAEHRRMELLTPPFWSWNGELEQRDAYARGHAADSQGLGRPYQGVFAESGCVYLYRAWDRYGLHVLGLTDAILARTAMPSDRPAHKLGLIPLAEDLRPILRETRGAPGRGTYRRAVERGTAAPWIEANLDAIEAIERKIYNRHAWRENLRLALTFPGPIDPGASGRRKGAQPEF